RCVYRYFDYLCVFWSAKSGVELHAWSLVIRMRSQLKMIGIPTLNCPRVKDGEKSIKSTTLECDTFTKKYRYDGGE
ncbi:hypothetical protein PFISCL1PPCAC_4244, partial [Pristionchus fissidentatus]